MDTNVCQRWRDHRGSSSSDTTEVGALTKRSGKP